MARSFGYGSGNNAIGEVVHVGEKMDLQIIGVIHDFNYARLNDPIHEFAFRYQPGQFEIANMAIKSDNIQATILSLKKFGRNLILCMSSVIISMMNRFPRPM